jgi:hypothetical protein
MQLDHILCELCGKKSNSSGDWGTSSYDVNEVDVSHRDGSSYPDGGNSTSCILDICPDCFKTKLVPWFEQQGGKPRYEENDY